MQSVIPWVALIAQTREELMRRAQFWEYMGYGLSILAFLMIPTGVFLEMHFRKKKRQRAEEKRQAREME